MFLTPLLNCLSSSVSAQITQLPLVHSHSGQRDRFWLFGFLLCSRKGALYFKKLLTIKTLITAIRTTRVHALQTHRSPSHIKNQSCKIKECSEKPCLLHLDNSVQNELKDKNAQRLPLPFLSFFKPHGVMDDIIRQFGVNMSHAGLCRLPS